MASTDVIRTLTIRAKTEGVKEATADVEDFGRAWTTSSAQVNNATKSMDSLERRFVDGARAQQDFAKVQRQLNVITAQNPELQDRANKVLEDAAKKLGAANDNTTKYTKTNQLARFELINLSRQIQDVGVGLASGQALFTVAIQQGSQIADVFQSSGVGLAGFAKQVVGMITPLRLLIGIGGLVAGTAVLVGAAWKSTETQFLDLSERLDVPISKLHELQSAAAFKGVDFKTFQTGFQGFSEQVELAKSGLGTLAELFRANGIQAKGFEDSFAKVADLVANAPSGQERFNIAIKAGLQPTAEVVRFLRQGSAGIQAAREEAVKFGDANDALVRKAREVDEAFAKIWKNFVDGGKTAFVDVFSGISSFIDKVNEAATEVGKGIRTNVLQQSPEEALRNIGIARLKAGMGGTFTPQEVEQFQRGTGAAPTATSPARVTVDPAAVIKQNQLFISQIQIKGDLATVDEKVKARELELTNAFIQQGVALDANTKAQVLNLARLEEIARRQQETVSALGDAAHASEIYQADIARLNVELAKGRLTQDQFNRAMFAVNPTVKQLKTSLEDLTQGFVAGILQGKSATDSLNNALKSVAAQASSATITNLIKGDFTQAAISGTVAIGAFLASKLFGGQTPEEKAAQDQAIQQQQQKNADAAQRYETIMARIFQAGIDASTREGALAQFDFQAQQQRAEEARAGGQNMVILEQALAAERLGIVKRFDDQVIAEEQQAAQARADLLKQINRQINQAQGLGFLNDFADLFDQIAKAQQAGFDPSIIAQLMQFQGQAIVNSAQVTGAAFQQLLAVFPQLAGAVQQFGNTAEQVAQRAATLDDRIFSALTDTATLAGALASFDRQAQKEREDEIKLGGANIVKLEAAQALERLNIYKEFNDRLLTQVQNLANTINQFLANLRVGPQSILAPIDRLAAAQTQYNTTLLQAQAGNFDAANQVTGYASQLLDAAKAVYGSTGGYVALFNQITTQLQALPAQVSAAQHIVDAINDNTDEVTAGNVIAQTQKLVLDVLNANTTANNQLVATTNALQSSANTILQTSSALLSSINALNSQMNASLSVQAQTLAAIQGFTSGANDNLGIIRHNSTSTSTNSFWAAYYAGTDVGFPGAKAGMNVGEFARGGWVYGPYAARDTVRARLTPGEFVVRRNVAQANQGLLSALNSGGGDVAALLSVVVGELKRLSAVTAASSEYLREPLDSIAMTSAEGVRERKFQAA